MTMRGLQVYKCLVCDSVVEAVGSDVTIDAALRLAARGGTVSVVGVSTSHATPFPMGLAFIKSITFRIGVCPVQSFWPQLVPLLQSGRLRGDHVFTHRLALSDGAEGYRTFSAREDGAMKVMMRP